MLGNGRWPTVGPAFLSGLRDPGFDPVTQEVSLEFCEYGEHTRQSAAARRGQV